MHQILNNTINSNCVVAQVVTGKKRRTKKEYKTGLGLDLAMSSHPHVCELGAMKTHHFVV